MKSLIISQTFECQKVHEVLVYRVESRSLEPLNDALSAGYCDKRLRSFIILKKKNSYLQIASNNMNP